MNSKDLFSDKPVDASADRRFIGVGELSRRWAISPSAIYGLKAGTHRLKRYRFGRSIKFLLTEVEHIEKAILKAEEHKNLCQLI